jgi:hypothetical protein
MKIDREALWDYLPSIIGYGAVLVVIIWVGTCYA